MSKERLTVTVDPDLVRAANDAVAEGRADSLSAWVNLALSERADKDRRLRALTDAVATYEAEFGIITPEELETQARLDGASAQRVSGARPRKRRRSAAPRTRAGHARRGAA